MQSEGYIRQIGSNRGGYWEVSGKKLKGEI